VNVPTFVVVNESEYNILALVAKAKANNKKKTCLLITNKKPSCQQQHGKVKVLEINERLADSDS
jgi:hypothetical protein